MNFKEAYPHLMKYWDFEKNNLNPEEVHYGSRIKKIYFKCEKGHSFKKTPANYKRLKTKNLNCPICLEEKQKKYKLFKDVAPEYIKYWDFEKNINVDLNKIKENSTKFYYFKCKKNHSTLKRISDLVKLKSKKINCNICSGSITINETKLKNKYPEISREYCTIKNKDNLEEISANSNKKYWWKCENNHYWKASVSSRTGVRYKNKEGSRCPYCWSNSVSRNELIIYTELYQFFKKVKSTKKINRKTIDIYIEDINLAIEYDGSKWHKDKKRDLDKNKLLKENNIDLIRIRENPLIKISKKDYIYDTQESVFRAIEYILKYIIENYKLQKKDKEKIINYLKNKKITNNKFFEKIKDNYKIKKIENKLLFLDYDYENNELPLNYYGQSSNYLANWKCHKCEYKYKKTIRNKSRSPNCKNCKVNKKKVKEKSKHGLKIKETHPEIIKELPVDRIKELENLTHTNSRVYFNSKCSSCNHEFKTNMWNKIKEKQSCPNCGFNIYKKETNLLNKYPELIKYYSNDNTINLKYIDEKYSKKLVWINYNKKLVKKTIKGFLKLIY